jgi:hypothetical protein
LRGQRLNQLDPQPLGHPAELGRAVAARRLLGVDPEYAVPVAVEGQRTAMLQHVSPQRARIGPRRLHRREMQRRPVASSTNTINAQRGPRSSNQACGLPSIWINSPNRGRRSRGG